MEVSQIAKDIPNLDYLRLLIVYLCCYELSAKDKSTMLKSLPEERHRTIVKNLEYLDERLVCKDNTKFRRKLKTHSKE